MAIFLRTLFQGQSRRGPDADVRGVSWAQAGARRRERSSDIEAAERQYRDQSRTVRTQIERVIEDLLSSVTGVSVHTLRYGTPVQVFFEALIGHFGWGSHLVRRFRLESRRFRRVQGGSVKLDVVEWGDFRVAQAEYRKAARRLYQRELRRRIRQKTRSRTGTLRRSVRVQNKFSNPYVLRLTESFRRTSVVWKGGRGQYAYIVDHAVGPRSGRKGFIRLAQERTVRLTRGRMIVTFTKLRQ